MRLPKPQRIKDAAYLEYVRSLPCVISGCKDPSVDAHHVPKTGYGKVGSKADDDRTVPLCRSHHAIYHDIGKREFELNFAIILEYEIERIKRGYRPPRRLKRELKPRVLHVAVSCLCKQVHKLPLSKYQDGWTCPVLNQRVVA